MSQGRSSQSPASLRKELMLLQHACRASGAHRAQRRLDMGPVQFWKLRHGPEVREPTLQAQHARMPHHSQKVSKGVPFSARTKKKEKKEKKEVREKGLGKKRERKKETFLIFFFLLLFSSSLTGSGCSEPRGGQVGSPGLSGRQALQHGCALWFRRQPNGN